MTAFMLDTNTVSHILRNIPAVRARLTAVATAHNIVISVISQAEIMYGLARRGHPRALSQLVESFLARVTVLPWDEPVARFYGNFRAAREAGGLSLSAHDMLIAAHAAAHKAVLVTRDKAFAQLSPHLISEDWSA